MRALILALSIVTAAPAVSQTQPLCAQREVIAGRLAQRYEETRHMRGIDGNGAVVETFASEKTGT